MRWLKHITGLRRLELLELDLQDHSCPHHAIAALARLPKLQALALSFQPCRLPDNVMQVLESKLPSANLHISDSKAAELPRLQMLAARLQACQLSHAASQVGDVYNAWLASEYAATSVSATLLVAAC